MRVTNELCPNPKTSCEDCQDCCNEGESIVRIKRYLVKINLKCTQCSHKFERNTSHINKNFICPECYGPAKRF